MKLKYTPSGKDRVARSPAWSYSELATLWGLTQRELKGFIMRFPGFPAAASRHRSTTKQSATYYDLNAAKAWWDSVPETEKPVSK